MMKDMNAVRDNGQVDEIKKHHGLRTAIALLILVVCWILWFVLPGGWIVSIGLSFVGCLAGERLGEEIFAGNPWFERLSVERSGFSILRIVLGVTVVILIGALFIIGRLAFSSLLH
jgi:hypothetical protein